MDIDAMMLVVFSVITWMVNSAFGESVFHGRGAVYVTDYQLGVGVGVIYRPQHYLQYSGEYHKAYVSFCSNLANKERRLSSYLSWHGRRLMTWDSTGKYYYYLQYEDRVNSSTQFGYSIWIYRKQQGMVYVDSNNWYYVLSPVRYCVIDSSSTAFSYNCSQALRESASYPQTTRNQVSQSTVSQSTVSLSTVLQSTTSTSYELHQQTEELKKHQQSFDYPIALASVCGAFGGIMIIINIIGKCRSSKQRNTEIRRNTVTREEIELSNSPPPSAPPAETERPTANNALPPSYQTALTLEMTYTNIGGRRHISNLPPPPSYQNLCPNCHSVKDSAGWRHNCIPKRNRFF